MTGRNVARESTMSRMLVVDDDPHIRALLRRLGERCGFVVDVAADGIEAMQLMETTRYSVALLDLMMPRFSGYEVLEKLRDRGERPKFIVVTAMTDEYIDRVAPDLVDAIVRKPFDIEMLTAVVREVAGTIEPPRSEAELQRDGDDQGIEIEPDGLSPR